MTNLTVLSNSKDLQREFDYVTSEIQEIFPVYLSLSEISTNSYVRGVLPSRLGKSTKQDLLTNIEKYTSIWEKSVNAYVTSLEESEALSYKDVLQRLVSLGGVYKVQYGFNVTEESNVVFTITLPNSSIPVFTKSVSNVTSVSELLTFVFPYLLQLPYHFALAQILNWSSTFELKTVTSKGLTSVFIQDTKTGTIVEISNSGSLCSFKAETSFCGETEQLSVETSQGYLLSWNGLAMTKPIKVSKVENFVPLPCLVRKVTDILGELPVYGEKTASGNLWTYK